ncbi:Fmp25p [Ascoidea rubescens DSM 1968]|uniref:RCC1/BLIP-II protein n=1 Tax=Ascoidea rubescens DSM 1968 TaxID=1344418 RepID=A0A1D2VIZ8_9ASCO|nr:RCC1/BLIP-II protein [Ascoidea rubescens DSM 1968]ODV61606.1 RCC1/BLIP-II protein [Ascoidea rubescens DSM 1968]
MGLGALALAVLSFQGYTYYPQIKYQIGKIFFSQNEVFDVESGKELDEFEKSKRKNDLKKKKAEFNAYLNIINSSESDSNVPGLYLWGSNLNATIAPDHKSLKNVKVPIRLKYFEGMVLKDVKLGHQSAYAIDENGDLHQWGNGFNLENPSPSLSLSKQKISKGELSNGCLYFLNNKNELLILPENKKLQDSNIETTKQSFTKLATNDVFSWGEKIVDFKTGLEHLIVLTNKGKVYSSATGLKLSSKSFGQFGLPEFSHFDSPPEPNKLYEIKLLNYQIEKNHKTGKVKSINQRVIEQVACGDYHTLCRDFGGSVWSFGRNTYGELGLPVAYDSEFIPFPKRIELFNKHFTSDNHAICTNIEAGGATSFATFKTQDIRKMFMEHFNKDKISYNNDSDKEAEENVKPGDLFHFSFGNGLYGQLGNGRYIHSNAEPTKIRTLMDMKEFNESEEMIKNIPVKNWSAGSNHAFVKLDNNDIYGWGSNEFGQLGNGKRAKSPKPISIPTLIEPHSKINYKKYMNQSGFNPWNNRLQLFTNKELVFKNPNGKTIKGKFDQVLAAGYNSSAIYYARS